ncbi:MAG: creatininase family protein [Vicinamibacterales bacterium]
MNRTRWPSLLAAMALVVSASTAAGQAPTTRDLDRINWMELKEVVPAKVVTVLLPLGSVEAHGVTANGSDILAPVAMAKDIAERVNAFVAPAVPYGITPSLAGYPGGITIPEDAYEAYVRAVLEGLSRSGFRNLILLNGHGGNSAALNAIAAEVANRERARALVINWWTYCSDITLEVFGEDGGHAGENENAYVMAIDPSLSHPERYKPDLALANPPSGAWTAFPHPASMMLYKEGQGYPKFDTAKAKVYFQRVNEKIAKLVLDVVKRWDAGRL